MFKILIDIQATNDLEKLEAMDYCKTMLQHFKNNTADVIAVDENMPQNNPKLNIIDAYTVIIRGRTV